MNRGGSCIDQARFRAARRPSCRRGARQRGMLVRRGDDRAVRGGTFRGGTVGGGPVRGRLGGAQRCRRRAAVMFIPKASTTRTSTPPSMAPTWPPRNSVAVTQVGPASATEAQACSSRTPLPRSYAIAISASTLTRSSRLDAAREGDQGRRLRLVAGRRSLRRLRQPDRLQPYRRRHGQVGLQARSGLHGRDRNPFRHRYGPEPERLDRGHADQLTDNPDYANLVLVDTVYGNDEPAESTCRQRAC